MYDDFCNQIWRIMTKWFIAGFWGHLLERNNNNVTVIFVVKLWLLRSLNQQSKPIWKWHIEDIVIWIICYNMVRIKRLKQRNSMNTFHLKIKAIWSLIKVNKTLLYLRWNVQLVISSIIIIFINATRVDYIALQTFDVS